MTTDFSFGSNFLEEINKCRLLFWKFIYFEDYIMEK